MGRDLSILIIDDNPDLNELYKAVALDGVKIEVVDDGSKAFPLMEAERFDAVLVDIAMPFMTGFSCVKEIRENEKLQIFRKPSRLAFFTAYNVDEVVREVQEEFNVERVFHKPIAPDELIDEVRKWLNDAERAILQ